jgi:hypothetical protein
MMCAHPIALAFLALTMPGPGDYQVLSGVGVTVGARSTIAVKVGPVSQGVLGIRRLRIPAEIGGQIVQLVAVVMANINVRPLARHKRPGNKAMDPKTPAMTVSEELNL